MIGWGDNNYCTFADGYSHTWNVAGKAIRIFNLVGDLVYACKNSIVLFINSLASSGNVLLVHG